MKFTITYTAMVSSEITIEATDSDDADKQAYGEIVLDLDKQSLHVVTVDDWRIRPTETES